MSSISPPSRILVLTKYRFIGDTLLAVPLLRAVSKTWPNSRVTLLSGGAACELLRNCPYVTDTIEFDPYRQKDKGLSRFFQIVSSIKRGHYDLAIICNRSFHSALLTFLARVPFRVGWSGFHYRDPMLTHSTEYGCDDPEQKSYLDLLKPMTQTTQSDTKLELWVTESETLLVGQHIPHESKPLIAIQPGASHDEKQWQKQKYAQLMTKIKSQFPSSQFLLVGGTNEREVAKGLCDLLSSELMSHTTNLVGELPLRQTIATLTYAGLFIGGDTAIRHCANALGVPSIALFGPTSLLKWGNTSPPFANTLQANSRLVSDIEVNDVFDIASMLLLHSENSTEQIPLPV